MSWGLSRPWEKRQELGAGWFVSPLAMLAHCAAFPPDTILPAQESFLQPGYLCLSLTQARRSPKHSPMLCSQGWDQLAFRDHKALNSLLLLSCPMPPRQQRGLVTGGIFIYQYK